MRSAGLIAFFCAGVSGWSYTRSALTTGDPIYCIASPLGACETIMASGYSAILGAAAQGSQLAPTLATFVPLTMWLTVVISAHNPIMTMRRGGRRGPSPAGWLYLTLFVGVLYMSYRVLTRPLPTKGSAAKPTTSAAAK
jgi:uncharacterized membrane protein